MRGDKEDVFNDEETKDAIKNLKLSGFSVFYFETIHHNFYAKSLNEAAELWIKDGKKTIVSVGRIG